MKTYFHIFSSWIPMYGKKPIVFPETLGKQSISFSVFLCFLFSPLVTSSLFHVEWHNNSGMGSDLRRSLVQPLAQIRVKYEIKPDCSGLHLSGSWKLPTMEMILTFWTTFFLAGLSLWKKKLLPARISCFSLCSSSCQTPL